MSLRIRKAYCFPGTIRYKEWDVAWNCESISVESGMLVVRCSEGITISYSSGWEVHGDEVTTPPVTQKYADDDGFRLMRQPATPKGKR